MLKFLDQVEKEAEVWVVPFDCGPKPTRHYELPRDREQLRAELEGLQATGSNTWIYRSLMQVFEELQRAPQLANVVYLFTDGQDNDRAGPYTIQEVVQRSNFERGPYDWLFYLSLGVPVPVEVRKATEGMDRVEVTDVPVGRVPSLVEFTVKPELVELGNLKLVNPKSVPLRIEARGGVTEQRVELRVQDRLFRSMGRCWTSIQNSLPQVCMSLVFAWPGLCRRQTSTWLA